MDSNFQFSESFLFRMAADCLPIADRYFEHGKALSEAGFRSHDACQHIGDFLCSAEEIASSLAIWHEMAKELVASYGPRPMPLHGHFAGFKSDILEGVRKKRSAQGLTLEWFQKAGKESWQYYPDSITQKLEKEFFASSPSFVAHKNSFSNLRATARKEEIKNLSLGTLAESVRNIPPPVGSLPPSKDYLASLRGAVRDLLSKELAQYELRFDRKLSAASWFVFTRLISKSLQFRFGFHLKSFNIEPYFYICHPELPKKPSGYLANLYDWQEHFEIRLVDSAPAFQSAYSYLLTPDEIEVAVRGIVKLYSIEHEYISWMTDCAALLLERSI